ncbi:MAG TPA: T9SS type A sorting domain-containing protein, partial [Chryseolinea sp.]|nr:T9SS type A sorting domain-containing protein [Chryseolinea sp.]
FSGTLSASIQVTDGERTSNVYRLEVTVDLITAVEETRSVGVEVYPNPNRGKFKFILPDSGGGDATVRILDSTGSVLYEGEISGTLAREADVQIPAGVYFLEVMSAGSRSVRKFIVH